MTKSLEYAIGTPGTPWTQVERNAWLGQQSVKRSYQTEVLEPLSSLPVALELVKYGELSYSEEQYPLVAIRNTQWDKHKPVVLITGGVHGYETSGVKGAMHFAQNTATVFLPHFNFIIAPCVSPWGFETINRWNPNAIDPNRSFTANSVAAESQQLMAFIEGLNLDILAHFDLHETTDSDNSEFRPALAARDGTVNDNWNIPDGFYLVGDSESPQAEFQRSIIQSVEQVTHIAPADENGMIIGAPLEQKGVINYPKKSLGLCGGFSGAQFVTTTEVYPDSPLSDENNCILAQVAAITGGLSYLQHRS